MEKIPDSGSKHVFKRIIYFNSNCKDLIIKTLKVIKDEILKTNSCDTFECIVYIDSFGIYCNNEKIINQFERLIINKLPDNTLIYPHYTVNLVNFEDIRRFQTHTHLPLGRCILEAIQVVVTF